VITWSLDYVNEEGAPFDTGFDDAGPFSVTPEADGVVLDAALREFGPAAFEDLIPRLRSLAADLDAAHTAGFMHGRLHPSKVFVTGDATYLIGAPVPQSPQESRRWPIRPPYTAPEVTEGATPAPTADQFSLAAIAYEWMFGRPISGPADRSIDIRAISNVDRSALSKAFTRALAPEPFRRFTTCTDFCDAIAASAVPSLPLTPPHHAEQRLAGAPAAEQDEDDPVRPFQPEEAFDSPSGNAWLAQDRLAPVAQEPDLDSFPERSAAPMATETLATATADRQRFSGLALILATIVGAVFGFAAGYMAKPRALQIVPAAGSSEATIEQPVATTKKPVQPAEPVERKAAPVEPQRIGRLLVRSTPPGASVTVDGVSRGITPLALRDLDLGARDITVSRSGYEAEARRILLTKARPSRSVEVRLSASAADGRSGATAPTARSGAPRPSTPASLGKPTVATGVLAVESRPTGAVVIVNGKASGTTPVTLNDLPPGDYRVTMTLEGHRPFATTVRVVAGERARAAARLTEQEQE
jgi:hypothetical protein